MITSFARWGFASVAAALLVGCTSHAVTPSGPPEPTTGLEAIASEAIEEFDLRAMLVKVTVDGTDVYEAAFGESMTGIPATTDMRFRNGAFAFTYIGHTFARMADEGRVSLDDTLANWLPEIPRSELVTIRNLLNMTSGYADYVYQLPVLDGTQAEPFKQWTDDELISIGLSAPLEFDPGTNWGYSHTNYVLLGKVLTAITGQPVDQVLQEYVIDPMGLTGTGSNANTPAIPPPVMHSFTAERREFLQIPDGVPFNEESTYWNPSWTTANGAVQTSTLDDVTRSMEIVGSGEQVSPEMYEEQTGPSLVGFGAKDPTEVCRVCGPLTQERHYGLGVVLYGDWVAQTKSFAGNAVTSGYLPEERVAVTVVITFLPEAFENPKTYSSASSVVFARLAEFMAPSYAPQVQPPS